MGSLLLVVMVVILTLKMDNLLKNTIVLIIGDNLFKITKPIGD